MKLVSTLLLLLLSACANHRSELMRGSPVNLNKQMLLSCLGLPDKAEQDGDLQIFTYNSTVTDAICPLKSLAGIEPPIHHCQAVFVLDGNKVRSIDYRQQDQFGQSVGSQCSLILEKCGN